MNTVRFLLKEFNNTTWKNKANRNEIYGLVFAILLAAFNIFGISKQPVYKSWSLMMLIYTLIYTSFFYHYLKNNGYFEIIGGGNAFIIGIAFTPLIAVSALLASDYIPFITLSNDLRLMSLLMMLFSSLFCYQNALLLKSFTDVIDKNNISEENRTKLVALKDSIRRGIFTSDLPSFLVFIIIFIYSLCGYNEEAFFYGAAAFQMLASNIVWILNDDPVFGKIEIKKNEELLCQSVDSTKKC